MLALLALCLGLACFDRKMARIPNAVTLPLLATGLGLHLPGSLETWGACFVLLYGWRHAWLGGGDAKLWLALLWLAPPQLHPAVVVGAIWIGTGALQLAVRAAVGSPLMGVKRPAAWRALPFAAWLALVS